MEPLSREDPETNPKNGANSPKKKKKSISEVVVDSALVYKDDEEENIEGDIFESPNYLCKETGSQQGSDMLSQVQFQDAIGGELYDSKEHGGLSRLALFKVDMDEGSRPSSSPFDDENESVNTGQKKWKKRARQKMNQKEVQILKVEDIAKDKQQRPQRIQRPQSPVSPLRQKNEKSKIDMMKVDYQEPSQIDEEVLESKKSSSKLIKPKKNIDKDASRGHREVESMLSLKEDIRRRGVEQQNPLAHLRKTKVSAANIGNLEEFVKLKLAFGNYIECTVRRTESGLKTFTPQYDLYLNGQLKHLINSQKQCGNLLSAYQMYTDLYETQQGKDVSIGSVKSNFMGSIFNVYDQKRRILCSIYYDSKPLADSSSRSFRVYVFDQNFSYQDLFKGTQYKQNDQIDLQKLYNAGANQTSRMIRLYENKKPVWNELNQVYQMNFRGKMKMMSVKNFILIDPDQPDNQVMLLVKVTNNTFYMHLEHPFSPRVAMGLISSCFDFKWVCQ